MGKKSAENVRETPRKRSENGARNRGKVSLPQQSPAFGAAQFSRVRLGDQVAPRSLHESGLSRRHVGVAGAGVSRRSLRRRGNRGQVALSPAIFRFRHRGHETGVHETAVECTLTPVSLVRPTYEALVRVVWALLGADDSWIQGFFSPTKDAVESDAETRRGPDVTAMLAAIECNHPAQIYQTPLYLKEHTWRAMHSYVHIGIRPVVQSFVAFPANEAASLLINANGMLMLATNAVRMAHGLRSPMLRELQKQYADCLPNA